MMKKTGKRWVKVMILLALSVLLVLSAFACGGKKKVDPPPPGGDDEPKDEIVLSATELALDLYDDVVLTAQYGEETVTFSSSAPETVSVSENGTLVGLKVGNAVITARAGEKSAACAVTVAAGEYVPTVDTGVEGNALGVKRGEDYTLTPTVTFKGKTYTDAKFSYKADSSGNISVTENKVHGEKAGKGVVTVQASWRNADGEETMTAHIAVTVSIDAALTAEHETMELWRFDPDGSGLQTSGTLSATALCDGKPYAADIAWEQAFTDTDRQDAVEVNAATGEVTPKHAGTAHYRATAVIEGVTVTSLPVEITVRAPVADRTAQTPIDMELYGNAPQFSIEDIADAQTYLDGLTLQKINRAGGGVSGTDIAFTQTEDAVAVTDIDTLKGVMGDQVWTLDFGDISFRVTVGIADKIIRTADDFLRMYGVNVRNMYAREEKTDGHTSWYGYFILGSDIDGNGAYITRIPSTDIGTYDQGTDRQGFRGTFDGRGHTVRNFVVANSEGGEKSGGLWGFVGLDGVIKNVAFVDISATAQSNYVMFAWTMGYNSRLENVFISTTASFGSAVIQWGSNAQISNVVAYIPNIPSFVGAKWNENTCRDVYVFNAQGTSVIGGVTAFAASSYKDNADFKAINFAEKFDTSESGPWTNSTAYGIPVFKTVAVADQYVLRGATLDLSALLPSYMQGATFASSDTDTVSVSGATATGAALGSSTVTATVNGNSFTFVVTVVEVQNASAVYEVSKHSEDHAKESGKYAGIALSSLAADLAGVRKVESGSVGGSAVAGSVSDGIWKPQYATLTAGESDWYVYGTNGRVWKAHVIVADKIITTADEFIRMYGEDDNVTYYATRESAKDGYDQPLNNGCYSWFGYFILGNDIDGNGANITRIPSTIIGKYDKGTDRQGFRGTFDGRGHTVRNFVVANSEGDGASGGLWGFVGLNGVIKNVAFTDISATANSNYIMFAWSLGYSSRLENVFISTTASFGGGVVQFGSTAQLKNVVVYVPNIAGFIAQEWGKGTYTDVYAFNTSGSALDGITAFSASAYKDDAVFQAINFAEKFDTSASGYWEISDTLKIPVFKTAA